MVRVFITGVTGYIGGQALYSLYHASISPSQISVLVHDAKDMNTILSKFPGIRPILGDINDTKLMYEEACEVDAVFHLASSSHLPSCQTLTKGLADSSRPGQPRYYVQMSSASMFACPDFMERRFGEEPRERFVDEQDSRRILEKARLSPTRQVERHVLTQNPEHVQTALVIGPLIFGVGQGPRNKRRIQVPEMARVTLEKGQGFRVERGESVWSNLHVRDVGGFFEVLLCAMYQKRQGCWNRDGIYTLENGTMSFGELGQRIAVEAYSKQRIKDPRVTYVMSPEEADSVTPDGARLWATNAVTFSERASKLGWTATHGSLECNLAEAVAIETERLQVREMQAAEAKLKETQVG